MAKRLEPEYRKKRRENVSIASKAREEKKRGGRTCMEHHSPATQRNFNDLVADAVGVGAVKFQQINAVMAAAAQDPERFGDLPAQMDADDPEAVDLLDRACAGRQGERTDLVDNVHEVTRPTGNRADRALRKLRADRPDLHRQVLAQENPTLT